MQNRAAKLKPGDSSVARGWRQIELPLRVTQVTLPLLGSDAQLGNLTDRRAMQKVLQEVHPTLLYRAR